MFFLKEEERTVTLHPSFFGPHIETYIRNQLFHDVEGQILGDYFTICVLDNILISEGKVIPGSAFAEFTVHYRAIVWKPFKGEVVDGTVGTCIEAGFFVDIGPLQAFVESGRIPPEVKFDPHSTPPQWTDGGDQIIEKNGHVRLKFMGLRTEPGKMFAVGDINFDYLGEQYDAAVIIHKGFGYGFTAVSMTFILRDDLEEANTLTCDIQYLHEASLLGNSPPELRIKMNRVFGILVGDAFRERVWVAGLEMGSFS